MYYINSDLEDPDIEYMKERIEQSIESGIAIGDITELYEDILNSKVKSAKNISSIYGILNPNSSMQVITYLENNMDANIEKACSVKGKLTSNGEAMKELARQGYQFAIDILTYRRIKKYEESLRSIMEYTHNGVVRPKISLGKTNRVNYKEPALMNIPKKLLWSVISPRVKGNVLISVDIKNQEPWILINTLDIEMLKDMLSHNEKDGLYNSIFELLYNKKPTELERSELKVSWNALTYGATKQGVLRLCKNIDGEVLYKFFNGIDELREYKNDCYKMAHRKQQRVETYFGTELYANELGYSLQRVLMDLPVQGTGSDILALLIKHADEEIEDRGLEDDIAFYFSRHDELIFEVSRQYVDEVGIDYTCDLLRDIMEHQVDHWEPFRVEISVVEQQKEVDYGMNEDE